MKKQKKKRKKRKLDQAIISYVQDPIFEDSCINIVEMYAAFKAAKMVLAIQGFYAPTLKQIIQFAQVAQLNDLKNSLRQR